MRFSLKPFDDDPRLKWHDWYAWRPVVVVHGYEKGIGCTGRSVVWLEKIQRKLYQGIIWGEGLQRFYRYTYRFNKCAE